MSRADLRLLALAAAAATILAAAAQPAQPAPASARSRPGTPVDWLVRGLAPSPPVPATLIQTLRGDGRRGSVQMKVQADGQGRTRRTFLQPLSLQGMVHIDDGRTWLTYFPDSRQVMAQPSPAAWRLRPETLSALIARNYRVTFAERARVAGRTAVVVVARPNDRDLATRTFAFDERTTVLLRSASLTPGRSEERVHVDTLAAAFPARVDPSFYERPAGPDWRQTKCDGPERVDRTPNLAFEPVVPERLPRGFVVAHVHRMGERDDAFVGVRLTDGLALATVYQWAADDPPASLPFRSSRLRMNADRVAFRVLSDLPDAVEEDLLEAFLRARRSQSGTPWTDFFVDTYIRPGQGDGPAPAPARP